MAAELLFSDTDWYSVEQTAKCEMINEIEALNSERVLNSSLEDLVEYLGEKYCFCLPVLDRESAYVGQSEAEIDVSHRADYFVGEDSPTVTGTRVALTVPFEGQTDFVRVRPTTFSMNPPRAEIQGKTIRIAVADTKLTPERIKTEFDQCLDKIEGNLANLRKTVEPFNDSLRSTARQILVKRKEKLLADQNLVADLGYNLKPRSGESATYAAPQIKRKIKPTLPPVSKKAFKPEPALSSEDYEHILKVLSNMTQVMERSPSTFATIGEEALRDHFLVQLNGQYEGQATGETFNGAGKTDILIRVDGKNIFIGECKFWGGSKKLTETLDQLLGYSCWRDTKVALMIFNRRKNLSTVLTAIEPTLEKHPNYKRTVAIEGETNFRFILAHKDDSAREMIVTVQVYDVPSPEGA